MPNRKRARYFRSFSHRPAMLHALIALAAVGVVFLLAFATAEMRGEEKIAEKKSSVLNNNAEGVRFFREKIEPVLKKHCYRCHSAEAATLEANLRLDSRAGLLQGGDTGPAVDLNDIAQSLLLQALRGEGGLEMPPEQPPLDRAILQDFVRWLQLGAPNLRKDTAPKGSENQADPRDHWAFQPVASKVPPQVSQTEWVNNPLDAFILSGLEAKQWRPAPPANRSTLVRRVYFDLTGLPPTPEEISSFVTDNAPDAYERLVDQLLQSPHFGERWAQHWLDVVRYAETEGYEYDRHLPDAWRFRDYVIQAFNQDKPFDVFLTEQIAGDERVANHAAPHSPQEEDLLSAAIFHRLGAVRRNAGNPDIALSRNEVLTDRTDIIGAAFLGLTVGCARCHNHKLEPISQKDYYRLQAFLASTAEHNVCLVTPEKQTAWELETNSVKKQIAQLKKKSGKASKEERVRLLEEMGALGKRLPSHLPTIPTIRNNFEQRTPIHVLRRGVWENKGLAVGPRPLSVLVAPDTTELSADVAQPRTQLAKWLASANHPLTARVIVNRLWQHHFGVGLVKTPNDFGTKASPPSHPELLDWLAAALVQNGWRLKPLHRMMVLSNTYRQSSRAPRSTQAMQNDPENRLLWRFRRRRLSAEEIRDAMLAASGRLNIMAGGPSVMTAVDPAMIRLLYKPTQWQTTPNKFEHDRRSIYLIAKRNLRLPFMEVFDTPALQSSCAGRESSTHAPQALAMLNGPLANSLAQAFAQRLEKECGGQRRELVRHAFLLTLGRPPIREEEKLSLAFLDEQPVREFALTMFNLNGFLYVE